MYSLIEKLAHLPTIQAKDAILDAFKENRVTVISGPTGSGKTLGVTALMSDSGAMLNAKDGAVLVLEPSRFLAINAASTLADIDQSPVGQWVGYAVGRRHANEIIPPLSGNVRIVYMTYGYAIATGALFTYNNIILDEVHLQTLEISLTKAILHHRMTSDAFLRIAIMSATMDVADEASHWAQFDVGTVTINSQQHPCRLVEVAPFGRSPDNEIISQAMYLISSYGCGGLLIFLDSIPGVKSMADQLQRAARDHGLSVIVDMLTSQSTYRDHVRAAEPPPVGFAKIIVGTNVMESGVNLPWVRGGISNGLGKESSVSPVTGALRVEAQPLPQWRLEQQKGRVNRFGPGIFVLVHQQRWSTRPEAVVPEVKRLPLTTVVLRCAEVSLDPHTAALHPACDRTAIDAALVDLKNRGFLDASGHLTALGRWALPLPVGLECAAALYEARKWNLLPQMIPIVAAYEAGGLKIDSRKPYNWYDRSDLIDQAMAFCFTYQIMWDDTQGSMSDRHRLVTQANVSYSRYVDAVDIATQLEEALGLASDLRLHASPWRENGGRTAEEIHQCLLMGFAHQLFRLDFSRQWTSAQACSADATTYRFRLMHGSAVNEIASVGGPAFATGRLRTVVPQNKPEFTVLDAVTLYTEPEMAEFYRNHPELFQVTLTNSGVFVTAATTGERLLMLLDPTPDFWETWATPVAPQPKSNAITVPVPTKETTAPTPSPKRAPAPSKTTVTTTQQPGLSPAEQLKRAWESR